MFWTRQKNKTKQTKKKNIRARHEDNDENPLLDPCFLFFNSGAFFKSIYATTASASPVGSVGLFTNHIIRLVK